MERGEQDGTPGCTLLGAGLSLLRAAFAERRSRTKHPEGFTALGSVFLPSCKARLGPSCCPQHLPESSPR